MRLLSTIILGLTAGLSFYSQAADFPRAGDRILLEESEDGLTLQTVKRVDGDNIEIVGKDGLFTVNAAVPYHREDSIGDGVGHPIVSGTKVLVLTGDGSARAQIVEDIANQRVKMVGREEYINPLQIMVYRPLKSLTISGNVTLHIGDRVYVASRAAQIEDLANYMVKTKGSNYIYPDEVSPNLIHHRR